MAHEDESQYSGNDHLRARFTMWLNTTLIRARTRYLGTHTQKLEVIPLDAGLSESIPDPVDYFVDTERSKNDFDFAEERLAKAFSELTLMRREVLRLLFVEEKTSEETAKLLCISPNSVYQFKHQALDKLRNLLTEGADENG